jgi:hypothetical protein
VSVRGSVEGTGEEMTVADYSEFPIRDQDVETRQTLDLLQGWGSSGRKSLRWRLGWVLVAAGNALQKTRQVREAVPASPSHCGLQ